ncbi:polysaccharide deacetylase family protein [Ureibacillus acetophenoni]|uniref:Polysaccharide deacetylase n=1 Tax=Ureibacillus acetophenoni TaxID=614649 RepID=A0A285U944_9BACL|nr:polysaccharide deacetylase family protein [Ureibacillus acetophenoni]SOC38444.1 polysaccharide deacetylase [Ureibacillus acetophenoni]
MSFRKSLINKIPLQLKKSKFFKRYRLKRIIKHMRERSAQYNVQPNPTIPYINKPGIVLSFDDSYRVDHWTKYGKELFGYYDVRATFNINGVHLFEDNRNHTQEEIDALLDLQRNGHEIVHQGFLHINSVEHSEKHGIDNWVNTEIIPLIEWMEKQCHSKTGEKFKIPVSFAFPYSYYNDDLISAIVPKYFKNARGNIQGNNLTPFNHTGFIPSIGIDRNSGIAMEHIKEVISIAKQNGLNIVFMCHSILPDELEWSDVGWGKESEQAGEYRISPDMLKEIIHEARKMDMEFYTLAELSGVATFIDREFEKYIRELLSCDDRWIMIKDLISIKELDLRNKNIKNLDGIQYFLNLEKIDLKNTKIKDFRLLKKLPHLKNIEI